MNTHTHTSNTLLKDSGSHTYLAKQYSFPCFSMCILAEHIFVVVYTGSGLVSGFT